MKRLLLISAIVIVATFQAATQVMPTILADGFNDNLIGIEVDADGKIWVTEYGTGNDDGKITILDQSGNKTLFMTGLPSGTNPVTGETAGAFRTYQLPDDKVLIVSGEGEHAQAEALLIVDKSGFSPGTPLTLANVEKTIKIGDFVHDQGFELSDPYNIAWDADGNILIADAGANAILKWDKATENLSIVKTLDPIPNPLPFGPPMSDAVPTDIVAKPDGSGFYVCNLTGFPFLQGAASIFNLDNDGNLPPWQTGFSSLTDLGYDPKDGNLCAMQFAIFGQVDTTLDFIPGTAAVIKVHADGSRDTIGSGIIGLAPSFTFDSAGDLYVTDLFGFVYKYDFPTATRETSPLVVNIEAFPNPFTDKVSIGFDLKKPALVKANIYDLSGKIVQSFAERNLAAGPQTLTWEPHGAQPGIFIYHLLVDGKLASGILDHAR